MSIWIITFLLGVLEGWILHHLWHLKNDSDKGFIEVKI